ncbi:transglycosylase SLT domain-containing protein [Noviherbaspirillum galbum]|uniref:Lytic transglycosylase domain-containing protein n=1 Tax=Noviherbaspirillum galbum TaxID=2709383 RepID=A0A6B3SHA0_9BURK|nr:transglycosylase SLT domain-containing protein [Noviherbaspirillum galbum]NEX60241.1 lytic transglycosylase domain-containing protein [Noviherbaspirillum galbum]
MIQRYLRASVDGPRHHAAQSTAWAVFVRDTFSGFVTTAHYTLMFLGMAAITALVTMFVKPDFADQLLALSPFHDTVVEEVEDAPKVAAAAQPQPAGSAKLALNDEQAKHPGNDKQQQAVTNWLSKRYRVASDAANMLVSATYLTAKEIKLDPLLILSVMAIESGFNPFAESPVGAQGLMQVMSKVHHDKFAELGGVKAALNPVANIKVGSLILKDYVTRGGSVEAGLKMYVGAGASDSDAGYGAKVLAEYRKLKDVAMGKKVPVTAPNVVPAPQPKRIEAKQAEPQADTPIEAASVNPKSQGKEQVAAL